MRVTLEISLLTASLVLALCWHTVIVSYWLFCCFQLLSAEYLPLRCSKKTDTDHRKIISDCRSLPHKMMITWISMNIKLATCFWPFLPHANVGIITCKQSLSANFFPHINCVKCVPVLIHVGLYNFLSNPANLSPGRFASLCLFLVSSKFKDTF